MRPKNEQLAERARAIAGAMLEAVQGDGLAARFVNSYAAGCNRPGLRAHASHYRELLMTIGRESLLAIAAKLNREVSRLVSGGEARLLRGPAAEAAERFRDEFLNSLAEGLGWTPAERGEFRRDLSLYDQIAAREPRPTRSRSGEAVRGAFVDRCALLLDPSMLDRARQAAGKYLIELEAQTDQMLHRTFGRARRR